MEVNIINQNKYILPCNIVIYYMIIAELTGKAEMLIRTEGYTEYSQGQRIVGEKIQSYHEAAT